MKLSLDKKLGFVQVKGQRLVEVTHEHLVPTTTANELDPHEPRRPKGVKAVTAKPGDYAVEMVAVKTGKVVGYSYISGEPIRLNGYSDTSAPFFKDAVMKRLELECDAFLEHVLLKQDGARLLAGLLRAKYLAGAALITFKTFGNNKESADRAWEAIGECLLYVPADDDVKDDPAHFVGIIEYPPRSQLCCHSQPPRHAGKHPCSGFQIEMLVRMEAPVFDPWSEVIAERAEFVAAPQGEPS